MGDFYEAVRFPDDYRLGATVGYVFDVDRVKRGRNGARIDRFKRSPYPYKTFDFSKIMTTQAQRVELRNWIFAMQSAYTGFRLKDWTDYKSTDIENTPISPTDQLLGTGDASETEFQLVKAYGLVGKAFTKPILKPVIGGVRVAVAGVEQTEFTDWTVDTTTGLVTFTTAPASSAAVTAGYEYDTPVIFNDVDFDALVDIGAGKQELPSLRFVELLSP